MCTHILNILVHVTIKANEKRFKWYDWQNHAYFEFEWDRINVAIAVCFMFHLGFIDLLVAQGG